MHGSVEPWWIWVEDAENETIYHSEYFLLQAWVTVCRWFGSLVWTLSAQKQAAIDREPLELVLTIPIFEPLPPQCAAARRENRSMFRYCFAGIGCARRPIGGLEREQ